MQGVPCGEQEAILEHARELAEAPICLNNLGECLSAHERVLSSLVSLRQACLGEPVPSEPNCHDEGDNSADPCKKASGNAHIQVLFTAVLAAGRKLVPQPV